MVIMWSCTLQLAQQQSSQSPLLNKDHLCIKEAINTEQEISLGIYQNMCHTGPEWSSFNFDFALSYGLFNKCVARQIVNCGRCSFDTKPDQGHSCQTPLASEFWISSSLIMQGSDSGQDLLQVQYLAKISFLKRLIIRQETLVITRRNNRNVQHMQEPEMRTSIYCCVLRRPNK